MQENKAAVVAELLRRLDPSHGGDNPIYSPAGEWSYDRFERWLVSIGVTAWPRLESDRLDTDGDAFRLMYHVPGIEQLHALRDSLRVVQTAKLPIGRDGRNRPSLFPFGTATGRNAHRYSLPCAGMRGFMLFPPDRIGLYLDWRTQEVAVAAARIRRSGVAGRLSRRRRLSHACARQWTDAGPRSRALEENQPDGAAAHEGPSARDQLRHGRAIAGERFESAPPDRQQSDRETPPEIFEVLGVAGGSGAGRNAGAPH